MPIGRSLKDRKKMAVSKRGKEAITHFKVLKRFKRIYSTRRKHWNRKNSPN